MLEGRSQAGEKPALDVWMPLQRSLVCLILVLRM